MPFNDILAANTEYSNLHKDLGSGSARLGLAIVTCIDSRIDPLESFGLIAGDAKILRNAGARVTDDMLRTLILATHVLGVNRIALIAHTDCGATSASQDQIVKLVGDATDSDASAIDFLMVDDQEATLRSDAQIIRECPQIAPGTEVGTFMFDVHAGRLSAVE